MNGPFGNRFPYTNFHEMNLDWMIQIAKDFLDQYTDIQNVIENGLTDLGEKTDTGLADLQAKYDTLEGLLDAWYTEHSGDIADQLADALHDLNEWYTTHEHYLDDTLAENILAFETAANAKAAETIASIPDDYTEVALMAQDAVNDIDVMYPPYVSTDFTWTLGKTINGTTGSVSNNASTAVSNKLYVKGGAIVHNYCDETGMNDDPTVLMVAEYNGTTFVRRRSVLNQGSIVLNDETNNINLVFGYLAATGNTETQEDIAAHFSMQVVERHFNEKLLEDYTKNFDSAIQAGNYETDLPDINGIKSNSIYRLNFAYNSTSIPAHTPYGAKWLSSKVVTLITSVKTKGTLSLGDTQLWFGTTVYARAHTGTAWQSWYNLFDSYVKTSPTIIQANNYETSLPDIDDITNNIIYRLNFSYGSTEIPDNTPYSEWQSKAVVTLIPSVKEQGIHSLGDTQLWFGSDGVYTRFSNGSVWSAWEPVSGQKTFVVDPDGNGDYTSFTEAVVYAYSHYKDAYVYVKRGTYDIIAEVEAAYGSDYFDNLTTSYGPISLRNGIHVFCEPETILECYYTGNNTNVMSHFSPVNFKTGDATLENVTIKASNVRYCIHDDQWDDFTPYRHYLKNVHLEIDNTNNTGWSRKQAFGGGLGGCGYIEFNNCYFKAAGLNGSEYTGYGSASFHNSPEADAQSKVVINNCYFADNSTFRFSYFGDSTKISEAFVSGCSMGRAMEIVAEQPSATIVNVAIIDCNNKIRT